ncbi:MAG TPA: NAD(P)-dependent oxidoreductase [Cyclobacteriaceae bacterium]|nr:NAD(P)-dependent oxidoreductase [Cyclobacteriaceae bacterium]
MKILITAPYNEQGRKELSQHFGTIVYKPWKPHGRAYRAEELVQLLKETEAEALITEHDEVNASVIDHFPHLKFIGVCRGTASNVAVERAHALGIPVLNTPARNAQAVAEMFIANVITFMRNTLEGIDWLTSGKWEEGAHASYLQFKGNELAGKTVGMVGFGAVGQTIAGMIQHFPCTIHYYDPFVTGQFDNFKALELEDIFLSSDIVSINLPVNEQTKGMIDEKLISLMKPSSIFVNMSRAIVVKRTDLLASLNNNKIGGAILDVFDHEPPDEVDYKLIRHPRVLATPHIAGATHEVEDHHVAILNKAILAYFNQNKPMP